MGPRTTDPGRFMLSTFAKLQMTLVESLDMLMLVEEFADIALWLRHNAIRIVGIVVGAFVLARLLRIVTGRVVFLAASESLAAKAREQQSKAVAGILRSTGTVVIFGIALTMILDRLGLNVTPILAGAGVAGVAIGFGAQTLVRDWISGLFIVTEDQFGVGDLIRTNGITGRVEKLTLRRTLVRDAEGALHTIPNGEIRIVANLTRDWRQILLDVSVSDSENVERILRLLENVAEEMRRHPELGSALLEPPKVLGVERISPTQTDIRMQLKTQAERKDEVARELRRKIKACFERERVVTSSSYRIEIQTTTHETLPIG